MVLPGTGKSVGTGLTHRGSIILPPRRIDFSAVVLDDILEKHFAPGSTITIEENINLKSIPRLTWYCCEVERAITEEEVASAAHRHHCSSKQWRLLAHLLYAVKTGDLPAPKEEDTGMRLSFIYTKKLIDISGAKRFGCWAYELLAVKTRWLITEELRPKIWSYSDGCIFIK